MAPSRGHTRSGSAILLALTAALFLDDFKKQWKTLLIGISTVIGIGIALLLAARGGLDIGLTSVAVFPVLGLMMTAIVILVFGPLATVQPADVAALAFPLPW